MHDYEREGFVPLDEVLEKIPDRVGVKAVHKFLNTRVSLGSVRYVLFKTKGTKCVVCGLKGEFFILEKHKKQNTDRYHLNLYGISGNRKVMLTKDHIIPKSRGGTNDIQNLQTMCSECNKEKGSMVCD